MIARLVHHFFVLSTRIAPELPVWLGYWLADRVGDLNWLFNHGTRAAIMSNQRHVLGVEAPVTAVIASTRGVFRSLARNYFDHFRLWKLPDAELNQSLEVHGLENLDQALTAGKGAILLTGHFGTPEVVSQILALRGYDVTVVVEHVQPEETFQLMTKLRESKGLKLIPIDKPLIGLIRNLRKGGIVGLVGDRDVTATGAIMPFFGQPTRMADGPVRLAQRTGAPIVVAYCQRRPQGGWIAFARPAYFVSNEGDSEEAVRQAMDYLLREMETFIRAAPEQWVISVPIWRQGPL